MKKSLLIMLAALLCLSLIACNAPADAEVGVTLAAADCTLSTGQTHSIAYTLSQEGAPVTFFSSAPQVASVDQTGLVTALSTGTAKIAVSAGEYSVAYFTVTVTADVLNTLPNVVLSSQVLELVCPMEYTLTATVKNGEDAAEGVLFTWKSSDPTVAAVSDGTVTALAPGQAIITATAQVDGNSLEAACAVTVYEYYKIALDCQSVSAVIGSSFQIDASIYDAAGQPVVPEAGELEYITSDPSAVEITDGTFKIVNIGSPSVGVRYKGNVATVPVDIFSVKADFFNRDTSDFYGEVADVRFSGVLFESAAYQPHLYFTESGLQRLQAYAADHGLKTLRVHAYAILKNNSFVINNAKWIGEAWDHYDIPISELTTDYDFWSQSEGTTEIYMWFEFL